MKLRSRHLNVWGFSELYDFFSIFPSQLSRLFDLVFGSNIQVLVIFLVVSKTLLIKSPIKQSLLHRTAGFFVMLTIAKATCKSKCIDISKGFVKAFTSRPQLISRIPEVSSANPSRQDD